MIKLAYRNVMRNRRRSVITLVAITCGLGAMLIGEGMLIGIGEQSERNLIDNETGHMKIFAPGYLENRESEPLKYSIEDPDRIVSELEKLSLVEGAAERVTFPIMLNDGVNDLPCLAVGIDPEGDARVFRISGTIAEGNYLSGGDDGMLIGSGLARIFGVGVGDYLTIITRTLYGAIEARDLRIEGIVDTGNPNIDRNIVYVPITLARSSLEMNGRATEIAVRLSDPKHISRAEDDVKRMLSKSGIEAEVSTWDKLAEDFLKLHRMKKSGMGVVMAIIVVVTAVGIANTMLMASFERTKEIGTLMALGMKPGQVLLLFLLEGAMLGGLGSLAGCLIGGAITYYLEIHGIDLSVYGDIDIGYPIKGVFYSDLTLSSLIYTFSFGLIVSIAASIYPARRASKLEPTEALRD